MHYVIGDVHGCFDELQLLLEKIEKKDPEAVFFFVGDWIDRGRQVPEVIQWVVEHITLTGKYRSVRGNHDQEALIWYQFCLIPWWKKESGERETIPETQYDFSSVVDQYYNGNPEGLEPFFEKVSEEMPYHRAIDITTICENISWGDIPFTPEIIYIQTYRELQNCKKNCMKF